MLYPPAFLAAQLDLVSVVAFSPTICSYAEPSNAHSPFKHTHRTHLFSLALQFTDAKPKAPGRFFFFFFPFLRAHHPSVPIILKAGALLKIYHMFGCLNGSL